MPLLITHHLPSKRIFILTSYSIDNLFWDFIYLELCVICLASFTENYLWDSFILLHVVLNYLFSLVCRITLWIFYKVFTTLDGHLGGFQFRAIMNKASVHVREHILWWIFFFFSIFVLEWGFPDDSVEKNMPANTGDAGDAVSIPGLGRSPGEEYSNPLQYSCLGNPMNRRAWWATVLRVAKSWIQLSDWVYMGALGVNLLGHMLCK